MVHSWKCLLYVNGNVFQTIRMLDLPRELFIPIHTPLKLEVITELPISESILHKMIFTLHNISSEDGIAKYLLEDIQ